MHAGALPVVADIDIAALAAFDGHAFEPPLHHALALAEEAMTADVHPVALVFNGARDAADGCICFEDYRKDIGAFQQFTRSSKPGRSGADDHRDFAVVAACVVA